MGRILRVTESLRAEPSRRSLPCPPEKILDIVSRFFYYRKKKALGGELWARHRPATSEMTNNLGPDRVEIVGSHHAKQEKDRYTFRADEADDPDSLTRRICLCASVLIIVLPHGMVVGYPFQDYDIYIREQKNPHFCRFSFFGFHLCPSV